jgi:hypothetical protein
MFTKDSRYAKTPTVTVKDAAGRDVTAVKLRTLPETAGRPLTVNGADQLDVIADRCYRDGARFWHIADANTELESNDLLDPVGRVISVPER